MRPIAPRIPGCDEVTVAEDQHEYMTIVAAIVEGGSEDDSGREMWLRWTFTPVERAAIAAGEDVYVSFPRNVFPHRLQLRPDWAGVPPETE